MTSVCLVSVRGGCERRLLKATEVRSHAALEPMEKSLDFIISPIRKDQLEVFSWRNDII